MVLEVDNIYKKINDKSIINNISFNLEEGKVLGILGPNGNGKTTLLNLIFGFLKADSGKILINGKDVGVESKKLVSFLQDKTNFPLKMTIEEVTNFYKTFYNDFNKEKMEELLEVMKLDKKMKIKELSKGMEEKLFLSLTLSRESKLFLLDEPITGVDPVAREKIINSIINSISENSSMIITTHYIGELENIFDDIIFIGEGKIVEMGNAEDLRIKYNASIDEIYRKIFAE